jgi:hypothetical protein
MADAIASSASTWPYHAKQRGHTAHNTSNRRDVKGRERAIENKPIIGAHSPAQPANWKTLNLPEWALNRAWFGGARSFHDLRASLTG